MRHPLAYRELPAFVYWPIKIALGIVLVLSLIGIVSLAGRDHRAILIGQYTKAGSSR